MDNIGVMKGLAAKMGYLNQRQAQLAQNVANADTPGYIPQDLKEVDFSNIMQRALGGGMKKVSQAATHVRHMNNSEDVKDPRAREQREAYEVAPAGNAVVLEEQMIKAGRNAMDYNLMTSLYRKNVNMLRMAIGRGG